MRPWSRGKRKREEPAVPEPAASERARADEEEVQISPLEQRLSTMDWPKPPPGVRERLFDQIVGRAEGDGASGAEDDGAAADGDGRAQHG
jgi:hypothetical protein